MPHAHTHKFEIADPDAVGTLIGKIEGLGPEERRLRLRRAVRWAEEQAVALELGHAGEKEVAFFHGLLTGYAVALKL
jgi:hypothetical protein